MVFDERPQIGRHKPNGGPSGQAFESAIEAAGLIVLCTFDEFVRTIGSTHAFGKFPFDDSGRALNPDSDKIALKMLERSKEINRKASKTKGAKLLLWPSKLMEDFHP